MAIKAFDVELIEAKMITPNVKHLVFKPADNSQFEFIPGQFITFLFDSGEAKPKRRSYSVATIPSESDKIEIAISYVEGGIATKNLFGMNPGETYHVTGPAGRLVLRDEPVKRLILVGTGTGIAPYRAMLDEITEKMTNDASLKVEIMLGVQYKKDALYADDFLRFSQNHPNLNFTSFLSRETEKLSDHEKKGYVQGGFDSLDLNPETDVVYLCGNPNMIDDAYEILKEKGFDIKNVRREKYISSN